TYDGTGKANRLTNVSKVLLASSAAPTTALAGLKPADQTDKRFTVRPYVLNTIDPSKMVIGAAGVYESQKNAGGAESRGDIVADITPAGMTGFVRALAYGGKSGGANRTGILFVGTDAGELFVRGPSATAAYANLVLVRSFTDANGIKDIVLDPDDWQTAYIV